RDHGREWLGTPTFLFLDGHSRLTRLLKRGHYLLHVQVCSPTRLPQRLLAAAAVIDAQLFKYSCQSGIFECQLPHTFLGSNGHSFGPPMFVNSSVRLSLGGMPALDFVQRSSGLPAMAESGVDIRNPKYAASRPRNVECAVQGVVSEQARVRPRKQDGFVLETSSNS